MLVAAVVRPAAAVWLAVAPLQLAEPLLAVVRHARHAASPPTGAAPAVAPTSVATTPG